MDSLGIVKGLISFDLRGFAPELILKGGVK